LKGLHLVELGQTILDHALASVAPDFEDNIQLASAELISANHLITRNKKDFDTSQIAVLTPEEWLVLQEVHTRSQSHVSSRSPMLDNWL
jgi:hypothetical protein